MVETGLMKYIPEIQKMIGCNQNKKWHMEGDCFEHTMLVLDNLSIKNKITTIRIKQETKDNLNNLKKYPCETSEEVLIRLIKQAIENESR
jgi:hypothetical protein